MSIVEWVQCKGCGRRHRWQAETAGTHIACDCGSRVFIPEVDVSGEQTDPDATIIETVDSPTAIAPGSNGDVDGTVFGDDADLGSLRRAKSSGFLGMGPFGEVIFFFCFAVLGFSFLAHAVIVQKIWYIALTVAITPVSFWKFNQKRKAWQGNRSFGRAMQESLES